jgi:hypothetical protein
MTKVNRIIPACNIKDDHGPVFWEVLDGEIDG